MFNVSRSKVLVWRKCRRAYHYKYVEDLRVKRKSRPLQFGSIVHKMLETYAEGNDPFELLDRIGTVNEAMFDAEREEYGNIIEDIRCIMQEYFDHWNDEVAKHDKAIRYMRIKGKSAEHEFAVSMGDIKIKGKIDSVAVTPKNRLRWLVEHKTFKALPNEDHRWRNLQGAVYIKVMQMMGWKPVDGVLWDYIKSKPPGRPQLLKSGKLSERALDTLPSRLIETLKELNQSPDEFKTLIMAAQHNRREYFQRIFNPTKQYVVNALFDEFMISAREMRELHGKSKVRNIERHCDWCDFEPICRADLQGSDSDFVKEREYYVSKDDYEELAVE